MKIVLRNIWLLSIVVLLLCSCDDKFSANAAWSDIPVVYGLLDQDEDTTFVRVQRCFVGDGDQREFAQMVDSIYYPDGAVTVKMEAWASYIDSKGLQIRTGDAPVRVFDFNTIRIDDKEEGVFDKGGYNAFCCRTKDLLDTSCVYRLILINAASGDTLATAETPLIYGTIHLNKPNTNSPFSFSGVGANKKCDITWTSIRNARRYQPRVLFKYHDFIDTTYSNGVRDTIMTPHEVSIACPEVKNDMTSTQITSSLFQTTFLNIIKQSIDDYSINKVPEDSVTLYVECCTEDMAAYIYAQSPNGSINQDIYNYTNVSGGVGVFAARRTHISFEVPTRSESRSGYRIALRDLGVGFH